MYVTHHDNLSNTILQGTLEGWRCRVRHRKYWMNNIKEWTSLAHARTVQRGLLQKRLDEGLCWIFLHVPPPHPPPPVQLTTQSVKALSWITFVLSLHGRVTQSQSTNGNRRHVTCGSVWAGYSPRVNGQSLYSILPLRKYGRVTHPQSTDRVYTVFRLLESMGELLTHSQRTGFIQYFAS